MRYYDLIMTRQGSSTPIRRWTSYPNSKPDPNALNVIFDIPTAPQALPIGYGTITVEGVSLAEISEAHQWAGMQVQLFAGMGGVLTPTEN